MPPDAADDSALVHLRVPRELKARWVRQSRAQGLKLSDWLVNAITTHEMENNELLTFANNGTEIAQTNFWDSSYAQKGIFYVSANAGTLRLLVPPGTEHTIAEMKTGKRVEIVPSIAIAGHLDIVFEDGTASPYAVTLDKRQFDPPVQKGKCRLAVWTRAGKQAEFPCKIL